MMLIEIFEEFINVFKENNNYTIGLLNQDGKVISCSNREYIEYHFDNIISNSNNVFYEINIKERFYGYMWISSKDKNIKMISNLVYDSFKTRLMYDINITSLKKKVTIDDELIKHLLNIDDFDLNNILDLISQLSIDKNKPRVAVYIINNNGFNVEEIMNLKLKADSKEMIYSLLSDNVLLLFKDVPFNLNNEELKRYFEKYVRSLRNWGLQDCFYLIGSMQNKLKRYKVSYQNCLWLQRNASYNIDKPVFFVDYLFQYFLSKIQLNDISEVFDFYKEQSNYIDIDEFIEITKELSSNDFNITQAAQDLFLHKNTLIYKIKKYEEIFSIDIRGSFQGKVLLVLISNVLKDYQKQKQVGGKV